MEERERRQALAAFLRQRRELLTPANVGLPAGFRRRTPGLRREEVAQLANIGVSWYVWLEQGRDVHPSAQVLECLAQALRLTANERRHLFLLAGESLPAPSASAVESVRPALQQTLDDLNPTPALILGRRFDYLAWNAAAAALFSMAQAPGRYPYNLVWRLFTNERMKARPNWEALARGTLAEFRAASARYPGDRSFEELIEDLKEISPEFQRLWIHHDARSTLESHKSLEHPTLGRLEFEEVTLQVLNDADIRIVIYAPDASSRAKLERLHAVGTGPSSRTF